MRSHIAKADSTNPKFSHKASWSAAHGTAVISTHTKFRFSLGLHSERCFCQLVLLVDRILTATYRSILLIAKRHPHKFQKKFAFLVRLGGRDDGDVQSFDLIDFIVVDLREDQLFLDTQRIIPTTIKSLA